MNERIKELLAKALDNETIIASKSFGHWPLYDEDLEKFAELIIKECMNICAEREEDIRTRIRDERQAATAYMCRAYIKEHFGVKE